MRIDHINIAAPADLLASVRDFYCGVLELEDGPRPDFGVPGYWLYGDGKPIIHLMESDHHYPADKPYYLDHIAFEVLDFDGYIARLDALGVEYSIREIPTYGISQVFCKDPCGNGVEANIATGSG